MSDLGNRHLVLLDLDGTISEPREGIRNGYRAAFAAVGQPSPPGDVIDAWIGPPLRQAFPTLGIPTHRVEEAIAAYRAVYNHTGWMENELYPAMPEVVHTLARRGPLALATAKPTGVATRILEHFDLRHAFAFVGGASDDNSRDTKAAVIEHCLDELAIDAATTVMVGDRAGDVEGATANGIPTVGVTWGHGSRSELRDAGAVAIVDHPNELLDLLR